MKTKLHRTLSAALLLLLFAANLTANNIQLSNVTLTDQNINNQSLMVQFDLAWANSWRTSSAPNNWDAAWVFVKYRVGSGEWQQAWLNDGGHSSGTGTGATIDAGLRTPGSAFDATTNPAVGVFIYRSADGTGSFSITNAQLRWNYGINGVAGNAEVEVKVFAIEMVYAPQGAFAAGSGGSENSAFTLTTINTADAATAPSGTGGFNGSAQGGYPTNHTAPANASWPNGYGAFYCMKYKISQQQYVNFLNTLTYAQQNNRLWGNPNAAAGTFTYNAYRHKIKIHTSGVASITPAIYETEHPYVACNWLSWMDGAAYSDWAGLRPMTELEFEKASRGTIAPVANEYAWGTTTATAANNITNGGAANETTTTSGANAVYSNQSNLQGPMRVGAFATGSSTRVQAGASYFGILELSGNLWELPVTVGNASGRAFTGVHGDGTLSTNGHANETAWPGLNSGEVTGAAGCGMRGGDWDSVAARMRVSDRMLAAYTQPYRYGNVGFRAVRLAP